MICSVTRQFGERGLLQLLLLDIQEHVSGMRSEIGSAGDDELAAPLRGRLMAHLGELQAELAAATQSLLALVTAHERQNGLGDQTPPSDRADDATPG
jgi:hypothetical protein